MLRPRIGITLLGITCLAGLTATAETPPAKLEQRVEAVVRPFADAGAFQGVVLLAVEGRVVYEHGFGKASLELDVDLTPRTRFQIASVSKSMTAAAILILAERGELDVDAPLSKVLTDYPQGDRLTIDHLLTHTSGIPNINGFAEYDAWSMQSHRPADLVQLFAHRPLVFEPGEQYKYSNSNYNLLAHIIEIVSGKSYGQFLEEAVFEPSGMDRTGHRQDPTRIISDLANGYVAVGSRGFARAPYLDWSIKTGNGSLYSTARDLLKFHNVLQSGELLSADSLQAAYGFEREVGYGWYPGERFGERTVTITGRSPGYTAHFERFIDRNRCLILLSNLYINPPPPLTEGLAAILLGRDFDNPGFALDHRSTPEQLERFAGNYEFGDDWFVGRVRTRVENRGDHLAVIYTDGTRAGYEFVLVPVGETTFFDRTHGGMVRFEDDPESPRPTLIYGFNRTWKAIAVP